MIKAWQDDSLSPRQRAGALVAAMTLEQKIAQLSAHGERAEDFITPDHSA